MNAARMIREARRRAGLSQRAIARRSGLPQSVIARAERGGAIPRVDTLDRLLAACGADAGLERRLGEGVDRTVIDELLALSPRERIVRAVSEARNLAAFGDAV